MKLGIRSTLSALLLFTGCSTFKQVPVIDLVPLKTGDKSHWGCGAGKLPYFYEGGYAAVCLPEDVVKFTVCAERLGLSETGGERGEKTDRSFAVEIPKINVGAETTLKTEQKATVTTKFEDGGPLAEARAKALDACARFLSTHAAGVPKQ